MNQRQTEDLAAINEAQRKVDVHRTNILGELERMRRMLAELERFLARPTIQ